MSKWHVLVRSDDMVSVVYLLIAILERFLVDASLTLLLRSDYRFELGLEKPDPKRALQSALTIAASYIVGGMIPLLPYIFIPDAFSALKVSVIVTLIALLIFGFVKGYYTGSKPFVSAVQTTVIGALASAAAFGIAKAINPS